MQSRGPPYTAKPIRNSRFYISWPKQKKQYSNIKVCETPKTLDNLCSFVHIFCMSLGEAHPPNVRSTNDKNETRNDPLEPSILISWRGLPVGSGARNPMLFSYKSGRPGPQNIEPTKNTKSGTPQDCIEIMGLGPVAAPTHAHFAHTHEKIFSNLQEL